VVRGRLNLSYAKGVGVKALFDTNIIIDALNDHAPAYTEIRAYPDAAISVVSYVEVMAGTFAHNEDAARALLLGFKVIDIDVDIADYAITMRQDRGLSLTDALIVATAQATGRVLVTRDAKLINEADDPPVVVPYRV
jgi:predicted nucleic acid-binding protein